MGIGIMVALFVAVVLIPISAKHSEAALRLPKHGLEDE